MKDSIEKKIDNALHEQNWPWWPLLPLYPYGQKKTLFKEIIPGQIWSFEQLQGIYYVAIPIRMTVVKVNEGLMIYNSLPPTPELLNDLLQLEEKYGQVISIILPTASGLEHKISFPALARAFPKALLWICPGQWSFPFDLPLSWLGIPSTRTKLLFADGFPHTDCCDWFSLGPLDIGLGRFQEVSCYHKKSQSLLVTDSLIGIEASPPGVFDSDPTALLFHSREKGDDPLVDSPEARRKGWKRIVLFASFLRPEKLSIPSIAEVLKNSFKPGLRNRKSHFGLYPFDWDKDWEASANKLVGINRPAIQIAPVLERLVFPRAKKSFIDWLEKVSSINGMKWLISCHYTARVSFTRSDASLLKRRIINRDWAPDEGNWSFLGWLDKNLLKLQIVPSDPISRFKD